MIAGAQSTALATGAARPRLRWGAIFAGAVAGSALSFVLIGFGSTLGLSLASTASTWRDNSIALWILTGVYMIFVALASFGLAGYIAGRMHVHGPNDGAIETSEIEFSDGLQGLVTWGLAVVMGAFLAIGAAGIGASVAVPGGGAAGTAASSGGETLLAFELDRLFRSDRRPADQDLTYRRSEAARILLNSSGHNGISAEDRAYLTSLVVARGEIAVPDADARVGSVIEQAHQAIRRARAAAAIEAFSAAAATLIGAVTAWLAAIAGGRDRERGARYRFRERRVA